MLSNDAFTGKRLHHICEVLIVVDVGVGRQDVVKSDYTASIYMSYRSNLTCPERLSVWVS